jgi:hypothetical protein
MTASWLKRLFNSKSRPAAQRRPARARLQVESLEERWAPAVDTVLTTAAGGAGSLADVMSKAAAGDTIVFAPGLSGTITPAGPLTVAKDVTIQGPGAGVLSVSGAQAHQVFIINAGVNAAISGLTITDGSVSSTTGNAFGGGIFNDGNLALRNDVIANSTASTTGDHNAEGGGIFSNGNLSLVHCTVSGNQVSANGDATAEGAGITASSQVLSVRDCTFTGNLAKAGSGGQAKGGGLCDFSVTGEIVDTAFTSNTASVTDGAGNAEGGGYFNDGPSQTTFTNLTFSGNKATTAGTGTVEGGGFAYVGHQGTFTNVTVTDNTASSSGSGDVEGGGAFLGEAVNWTGGLVSGNTASNTGSGNAKGGGIFNDTQVALDNLTVSNNHATANSGFADGGGLFNDSTLTVTADTLANNSASSTTGSAQAGGIFNSGTLAATNATLFGNSVTAAGNALGGGLVNIGTTTLINDTLASNTATGSTAKGGGIFNSSTLNLVNTIVFDPNGAATDPDITGPITATQNSLYGSNVAGQIAAGGNLGGNQFNINPMLASALADNGGPTETLALLPGSPAIGAGTSISPLGTIPTTDQRGLPRQGATDIGAFQVQPPPAPVPTPAPERAFVVNLVVVRLGKKKVLFVVEQFADTGAIKAVFPAPFQPGRFKDVKVIPVVLDGDGVFDLLIFTAVRKRKTFTAYLPA